MQLGIIPNDFLQMGSATEAPAMEQLANPRDCLRKTLPPPKPTKFLFLCT